MEEGKSREALRYLAKGTQYTRLGLFRWRPDYGKAAREFAKAALAFSSAHQLKEAVGALFKEAEAHEQNRVPLRAAMAYERASLYLSQSEQLGEAAQAVKRAVSLSLERGAADVAACTLRRFSQLLESQIPHQVVPLYQRASQLFEAEEHFLPALDFSCRASKLLVRLQRYGDAAISLSQEKHLYAKVEVFTMCHQRALAQCLAHLCGRDFSAASQCLQDCCVNFPTFQFSDEYVAMVALLNSYEDQDQEGVDEVCSSPVVQYLDEVYREMTTMLKMLTVENLSFLEQ